MKLFFKTIKYDYLQRTRSYAFLITLCASLAIAYTFVPEPNANYSTIRIADFVGDYNAAWFGYVTAIMTSVFLSLIGFYLVNSGIKVDIDTKVGQIVFSTAVTNFKYLFSKVLSNFFVLLTIVGIVFLMSIVLFFLYNNGTSFNLFQFIKPYTLITIPSLFFVSVIAVVFEVCFGRYSIIQNVLFFFLFSIMMVFVPKTEAQYALDVFGNKIVIHEMEEMVRLVSGTNEKQDLAIGYVLGNTTKASKFNFNGIDFPLIFILSRLLWMCFGICIIALISYFFHRFDVKEHLSTKLKSRVNKSSIDKDISLSQLTKLKTNYSIFPILKTEILLLIRKEKKWLWLINVIGMVLLTLVPFKMAHQIGLPILWFLQVSRLSNLVTKETFNNTHYFVFASYKPLQRVLFSQILAGIMLMLFLSAPLIIRCIIEINYVALSAVVLGAVFIVLLASALGILSNGKKLFEVLFFMITYANINGIKFVDYFGGFQTEYTYILKLLILVCTLVSLVFFMRRNQLKNMT